MLAVLWADVNNLIGKVEEDKQAKTVADLSRHQSPRDKTTGLTQMFVRSAHFRELHARWQEPSPDIFEFEKQLELSQLSALIVSHSDSV